MALIPAPVLAPVRTARLELRPMDARTIHALQHGDRATLESATEARFGDPLAPPPLLGDALPFMASRLAAHPDELGWWSWLVIRTDDRRAIGSIGFGGRPDPEGALVLGYSTYADAHGRGYATEAVRALIAWAFSHPEVGKVCATIPCWNAASRRVAEKVGMRRAGLIWEEELGEDVELWGVERGAGSH